MLSADDFGSEVCDTVVHQRLSSARVRVGLFLEGRRWVLSWRGESVVFRSGGLDLKSVVRNINCLFNCMFY